jgi:hypothetical protein
MTRSAFLTAYRGRLVALYAWAQDTAKLDRFMASVEQTLSTKRATWNHSGQAVTDAWYAIGGGKGIPSLKALRALPA